MSTKICRQHAPLSQYQERHLCSPSEISCFTFWLQRKHLPTFLKALSSLCLYTKFSTKSKRIACKRPSYLCIHVNLSISNPEVKDIWIYYLKQLFKHNQNNANAYCSYACAGALSRFFPSRQRKKEGPKQGLSASQSSNPTPDPSHWRPQGGSFPPARSPVQKLLPPPASESAVCVLWLSSR